jgi:hypothetical protein
MLTPQADTERLEKASGMYIGLHKSCANQHSSVFPTELSTCVRPK